MKKVFGEDGKFVLEANVSLEAVEEWTDKIFNENADNVQYPAEVWQWFKETVFRAYKKAESPLIRKMILLKVIHTREVVRAGLDIVRGEGIENWNILQVGTVCILHDISRFDQALLGSFSDTKTNFDHAAVGARMIEDRNFGKIGVDMDSVIDAVKQHSAYAYVGNDPYGKLVRDADKLALLRAMPEILEVEIGGFKKEGMTEEALQEYKRGELVKRENMRTMTDLFLAWLAWEYDFNFAETKRAFYDEGIREWMLGELKNKYGVSV